MEKGRSGMITGIIGSCMGYGWPQSIIIKDLALIFLSVSYSLARQDFIFCQESVLNNRLVT